jgi:hypothetical protein
MINDLELNNVDQTVEGVDFTAHKILMQQLALLIF